MARASKPGPTSLSPCIRITSASPASSTKINVLTTQRSSTPSSRAETSVPPFSSYV